MRYGTKSLLALWLYIPVNNFSVMLESFLGIESIMGIFRVSCTRTHYAVLVW